MPDDLSIAPFDRAILEASTADAGPGWRRSRFGGDRLSLERGFGNVLRERGVNSSSRQLRLAG